MATAPSYTSGRYIEKNDFRSRMVSDVAVTSIENVGFPGADQNKAGSARPLQAKREVEDDFERDYVEGENWLDADDDVLRARLRKRGLKLGDIPLF